MNRKSTPDNKITRDQLTDEQKKFINNQTLLWRIVWGIFLPSIYLLRARSYWMFFIFGSITLVVSLTWLQELFVLWRIWAAIWIFLKWSEWAFNNSTWKLRNSVKNWKWADIIKQIVLNHDKIGETTKIESHEVHIKHDIKIWDTISILGKWHQWKFWWGNGDLIYVIVNIK